MAEAQRLEELKLSAVESRLDARLALRADAELPKEIAPATAKVQRTRLAPRVGAG